MPVWHMGSEEKMQFSQNKKNTMPLHIFCMGFEALITSVGTKIK